MRAIPFKESKHIIRQLPAEAPDAHYKVATFKTSLSEYPGSKHFLPVDTDSKKQITRGDLHGNALNLINTLVSFGILVPKGKDEKEKRNNYKAFNELYRQDTSSIRPELLSAKLLDEYSKTFNKAKEISIKIEALQHVNNELKVKEHGFLKKSLDKKEATELKEITIKREQTKKEILDLQKQQNALIDQCESIGKDIEKAKKDDEKLVKDPAFYKDEKYYHHKNNSQLTKENVDIDIPRILSHFEIRAKPFLRLLGDILGDRGANDILTLKIIEKLHQEKLPFEILFSDHDQEFISMLYRDQNLAKTPDKDHRYGVNASGDIMQRQSGIRLAALFADERVKRSDVEELFKKTYVPHMKLISYSLSPDDKRMTLFTHAPVDAVLIAKFLAQQLGLKTIPPYKDIPSSEELMKTIDTINQIFVEKMQKGGEELKAFLGLKLIDRIIWNRPVTSSGSHYLTAYLLDRYPEDAKKMEAGIIYISRASGNLHKYKVMNPYGEIIEDTIDLKKEGIDPGNILNQQYLFEKVLAQRGHIHDITERITTTLADEVKVQHNSGHDDKKLKYQNHQSLDSDLGKGPMHFNTDLIASVHTDRPPNLVLTAENKIAPTTVPISASISVENKEKDSLIQHIHHWVNQFVIQRMDSESSETKKLLAVKIESRFLQNLEKEKTTQTVSETLKELKADILSFSNNLDEINSILSEIKSRRVMSAHAKIMVSLPPQSPVSAAMSSPSVTPETVVKENLEQIRELALQDFLKEMKGCPVNKIISEKIPIRVSLSESEKKFTTEVMKLKNSFESSLKNLSQVKDIQVKLTESKQKLLALAIKPVFDMLVKDLSSNVQDLNKNASLKAKLYSKLNKCKSQIDIDTCINEFRAEVNPPRKQYRPT